MEGVSRVPADIVTNADAALRESRERFRPIREQALAVLFEGRPDLREERISPGIVVKADEVLLQNRERFRSTREEAIADLYAPLGELSQ